jgi:hypothetical protein
MTVKHVRISCYRTIALAAQQERPRCTARRILPAHAHPAVQKVQVSEGSADEHPLRHRVRLLVGYLPNFFQLLPGRVDLVSSALLAGGDARSDEDHQLALALREFPVLEQLADDGYLRK